MKSDKFRNIKHSVNIALISNKTSFAKHCGPSKTTPQQSTNQFNTFKK